MKTGIELIAQERQEQISKHGWNSDHDVLHERCELRMMAAVLCCYGTDATVLDMGDEFSSKGNVWGLEEKLKHDDIHRLKVAGALIAAEIDRIQSLPSQLIDPVKQLNNCDGCQSNAPLDGIYHLDKDGTPYMTCQKSRYQAKCKQPPTQPEEDKEELAGKERYAQYYVEEGFRKQGYLIAINDIKELINAINNLKQ